MTKKGDAKSKHNMEPNNAKGQKLTPIYIIQDFGFK